MRLAYGAVQRKGTLDYLIERLAERPVGKLDAPLLAALRLGMYELLYLGGAPDRAVVADVVELAKTGAGERGDGSRGGVRGSAGRGARGVGRDAGGSVGRGGHGLVNAVLRRATREGAALLAELDDGTPEGAALKHSHPEWIARLWWDALGAEDARALLAFDNEPAELALRVNTLVADPAVVAAEIPVAVHRDPNIPEALVLDGRWDVHGSELWRTGAVLAQSRGAMLSARALDPQAGERVLDLCAAPGGKTTHLAALMGGTGGIVAVERNSRRAEELRRTVARMGAECVHVVVGDATRPLGAAGSARPAGDRAARGSSGGGAARASAGGEAPEPTGDGLFDRVLVDPPCTGLGTLQARADLRWRVGPEDVAQLARTQAAILAAGAQVLRPGGVLVYSTCTISPTENERQISAFLESNPDFALDDQVLTLPHRDRTAGFFIARLRRG
jgi:16S rRNA (cytosine967-C5)-methyltransferase